MIHVIPGFLFYFASYSSPQLGILGPSTLSNALSSPLGSLVNFASRANLESLHFSSYSLHPLDPLLTLEVRVSYIICRALYKMKLSR